MSIDEMDAKQIVGHLNMMFDWKRRPHEGKFLQRAIELLKKQEPIKPTVSCDTYICSKCGHDLESQKLIDDKEHPQILIHEQYQYCPSCGQAVKWM